MLKFYQPIFNLFSGICAATIRQNKKRALLEFLFGTSSSNQKQTQTEALFQLKGYSIKYETIRRRKLY